MNYQNLMYTIRRHIENINNQYIIVISIDVPISYKY